MYIYERLHMKCSSDEGTAALAGGAAGTGVGALLAGLQGRKYKQRADVYAEAARLAREGKSMPRPRSYGRTGTAADMDDSWARLMKNPDRMGRLARAAQFSPAEGRRLLAGGAAGGAAVGAGIGLLANLLRKRLSSSEQEKTSEDVMDELAQFKGGIGSVLAGTSPETMTTAKAKGWPIYEQIPLDDGFDQTFYISSGYLDPEEEETLRRDLADMPPQKYRTAGDVARDTGLGALLGAGIGTVGSLIARTGVPRAGAGLGAAAGAVLGSLGVGTPRRKAAPPALEELLLDYGPDYVYDPENLASADPSEFRLLEM